MYKTLGIAVVLLAVLAFTSGSRSADASLTTPIGPGPTIVAHGRLVNQTAPIPTTTIFTPSQTGLYRLSVYATVLNSGVNGYSWYVGLAWTDDQGQQSIPSLLWSWDQNPPGQFWQGLNQAYSNSPLPVGGPATVFEAKAGTPITYSVTSAGADGTAYSLYYTLERLE